MKKINDFVATYPLIAFQLYLLVLGLVACMMCVYDRNNK